MQAGKLNRLIAVQQRTQGQDEAGQVTDVWTEFAKVWAWIKGQNGMAVASQTSNQDGVAMSVNAYSFRIRYRPTITDDMRVLYGGVIFDIKQVRHDLAGHDWTDIVCEAGGNNG